MENILKGFIIKNAKLELKGEDIKEYSNLIDDLGYDSLQMIQLILDCENHFGFMFEEEDLFIEQLSTFGSFKELVVRKCANKTLHNENSSAS